MLRGHGVTPRRELYRGSKPREGVVLCEFREVGPAQAWGSLERSIARLSIPIGSRVVVDVLHTAQRVQQASCGVPWFCPPHWWWTVP
jgi:hypothetical protein